MAKDPSSQSQRSGGWFRRGTDALRRAFGAGGRTHQDRLESELTTPSTPSSSRNDPHIPTQDEIRAILEEDLRQKHLQMIDELNEQVPEIRARAEREMHQVRMDMIADGSSPVDDDLLAQLDPEPEPDILAGIAAATAESERIDVASVRSYAYVIYGTVEERVKVRLSEDQKAAALSRIENLENFLLGEGVLEKMIGIDPKLVLDSDFVSEPEGFAEGLKILQQSLDQNCRPEQVRINDAAAGALATLRFYGGSVEVGRVAHDQKQVASITFAGGADHQRASEALSVASGMHRAYSVSLQLAKTYGSLLPDTDVERVSYDSGTPEWVNASHDAMASIPRNLGASNTHTL